MNTRGFPLILGALQTLLALRVMERLLRTARGERVQPTPALRHPATLSIIVPVLNEYARLAPCLEGLLAQGEEVAEILVVDGGSRDGTQALVAAYERHDPRIRLLDASPIPAGWNGKAWGLHSGFQQIAQASEWVLTLDADVRPAPLLARSLLAHALKTGLEAFSVATLQEIVGSGQGLLHPALLTTLVYRFGIPGHAIRAVQEVQANGQCFLCQRALLARHGGFTCAQTSCCEDVTMARTLVSAGHAVGFYEAGSLVSVEMYQNWQETWENWTRSLPMRDHFSGLYALTGWLEIALVQALPLPLFLCLLLWQQRARELRCLNGLLSLLRLGVLLGTARAYHSRPWSYWLSPLCDLPVALKLGSSALRRQHTWRGRPLLRGDLP